MNPKEQPVVINIDSISLNGDLVIPQNCKGIVLFAHGSGSSRKSPRNRYVASVLQQQNLATLLMDLLTEQEEQIDMQTAHLRFNIPLLCERLVAATDWLTENKLTKNLNPGYFGASTGASAALIAATERPKVIKAVVSRGGRTDLAGSALLKIKAPTLFIVGGEDHVVLEINRNSFSQLACEKELAVIPQATHLFEEPGALEQVANHAKDWFLCYL